MIKITILATIAILATTAVFTMAFNLAQAQPPMDNATMGNMTGGNVTMGGGNMTDGNSTDAVGSISFAENPFAPG
jgi:Spy/CpxP family protein refolding chaperone